MMLQRDEPTFFVEHLTIDSHRSVLDCSSTLMFLFVPDDVKIAYIANIGSRVITDGGGHLAMAWYPR